MSGPRDLILDHDRLALKIATRHANEDAGGTDKAGRACGSRQQRMSDCQLRNTPDFLRIDEAAAIEDHGHGRPHHPAITRAMALRQGYGLYRLPQTAPGNVDWLEHLAALTGEAGELSSKLAAALKGNRRVDRAEITQGGMREDARDLLRVVVSIVAELDLEMEGRAG